MTEADATISAVGSVRSSRSVVFVVNVRRTSNGRRQAAQQLTVLTAHHHVSRVGLRPRRRRHGDGVIARTLAAAGRTQENDDADRHCCRHFADNHTR